MSQCPSLFINRHWIQNLYGEGFTFIPKSERFKYVLNDESSKGLCFDYTVKKRRNKKKDRTKKKKQKTEQIKQKRKIIQHIMLLT